MPFFRIFLSVLFTGLVLYLGYINFDAIYRTISNIDIISFALLTLALLIFVLLQGLALFQVMKLWGISLRTGEWAGLTVVTFMANFLVPFLGFGVRAVYLKNKHGFPFGEYAKSLVVLFAFELMIFGGGGLIAALFAGFPVAFVPLLWFAIALMAIGLALSFFLRPSIMGPLERLARTVLEPWQNFWKRMDLAIGLFAIMVVQYASFVIAHHVAFTGLDISVSTPVPFVAASLVDFSFLLRLTPANLGGYEGALMLAGIPEHLGFADAVAVASILRAGMLVVLVPLTPFFIFAILNQSKPRPE